ncbi:hypothetical protein HOLleu_36946 [Holothuria leucospilota]|uniref:Sulfotransferase family protein n=1 Tax=Holothuria leucospilota TaxID=206669 RepID=A0A9Q1BF32_HOLLE|nr:hypothetical protein HOLleu_36946 [Holothuria leucospilota]
MQVWFEPYVVCHHNITFRNPKYLAGDAVFEACRKNFLLYKKKKSEEVDKLGYRDNLFPDEIFSYTWVKSQLEKPDPRKNFIFVKAMIHAVDGIPEREYLPEVKFKHTFLIRNPISVYPSLKKSLVNFFPLSSQRKIDDYNLLEDFPFYSAEKLFQKLHDMWTKIQHRDGEVPTVIDADDLANHPEILLPKYFDAVGFPWRDDLLSWDAKPDIIREWKCSHSFVKNPTRSSFFAGAVHSSRFIPREKPLPEVEDMTEDLQECIYASLPFYEELSKNKLTI